VPVTKAPSTEAMEAIRDRVNAGSTYCIDVRADYTEQIIDPLEDMEFDGLRVDIVTEQEETLNETLTIEDRTSLSVRICIRKKVSSFSNDEIDPLKLVARQIYQQVNNYDTADQRVRVWECDLENIDKPGKELLMQAGLFLQTILLRVEVEAS
jgi:hypothetical protein